MGVAPAAVDLEADLVDLGVDLDLEVADLEAEEEEVGLEADLAVDLAEALAVVLAEDPVVDLVEVLEEVDLAGVLEVAVLVLVPEVVLAEVVAEEEVEVDRVEVESRCWASLPVSSRTRVEILATPHWTKDPGRVWNLGVGVLETTMRAATATKPICLEDTMTTRMEMIITRRT